MLALRVSIECEIARLALWTTSEECWLLRLWKILLTILRASIRISIRKAWSNFLRFFSLLINSSIFRQKIFVTSVIFLFIFLSVPLTTQKVEMPIIIPNTPKATRKSNKRVSGFTKHRVIKVIPLQMHGGKNIWRKVFNFEFDIESNVLGSSSEIDSNLFSSFWIALKAASSSGWAVSNVAKSFYTYKTSLLIWLSTI